MWVIARELDEFKKKKAVNDFEIPMNSNFIQKLNEFKPLKGLRKSTSHLKKIKNSQVIVHKEKISENLLELNNNRSNRGMILENNDEMYFD